MSLGSNNFHYSVTGVASCSLSYIVKGSAMTHNVFILLILVLSIVSCGVSFIDVPIVPSI